MANLEKKLAKGIADGSVYTPPSGKIPNVRAYCMQAQSKVCMFRLIDGENWQSPS